jgi:hypothetical protein
MLRQSQAATNLYDGGGGGGASVVFKHKVRKNVSATENKANAILFLRTGNKARCIAITIPMNELN